MLFGRFSFLRLRTGPKGGEVRGIAGVLRCAGSGKKGIFAEKADAGGGFWPGPRIKGLAGQQEEDLAGLPDKSGGAIAQAAERSPERRWPARPRVRTPELRSVRKLRRCSSRLK